MSAEYLKQVRERFVTAYSRLLADTRGQVWSKPKNEGHLHAMKVEFDAALALVHDTASESDWVRKVLAEHGYSGPLTETSCPLREWLAPKETKPVPATFTEYIIDIEHGAAHVFFDRAQAATKMSALLDQGTKFTCTSDAHNFGAEWNFACDMLAKGVQLSALSIHTIKLGIAAGMTPDL